MAADGDDGGRLRYRQRAVLALLARGLSVGESAQLLGVSASTVEHERTGLRRSLGARTLPHLVAIAYESGILPLEPARREGLGALRRAHLPQRRAHPASPR